MCTTTHLPLQMTIPLVSGGFNSSVIRQNAALVDAAKANYDNYRRTAAQNTRTAFTGFYGGLASVRPTKRQNAQAHQHWSLASLASKSEP